ncbi:hypothetical protein DOK78_000699 [Enterococcus sp. DIV2402]|uniref:HTH cro/C1-type domain-containing protein n=1 Tax=Candidatus Enterococcus lowellii TaxID=2230877 RepID=A0ABZ2SJQ3_9ENTE|nr:helix-turn-helix transcriptional regulator [Enterococcus sp. DIV2402]MBO0465505.1 helix-turn-helix transcriptional regulator [Enterococcus sp. DIV2402]
MSLAQNIVRFRKENELSQQQLAEQLNISRQSVSKWENGESLPGIDNLILLSGLLNISLDELITGEAYLSFPLHYGKPQSAKPAIILITILVSLFIGSLMMEISEWRSIGDALSMILISLFVATLFYVFLTYCLPYDYKTYYSYWTLEKKGISYPIFHTKIMSQLNGLEQFILPIFGILGLRKTAFIAYNEITEINVCFKKYKLNPTKVAISWNGYTPRMHQTLREPFYLQVTTRKKEVIELDLRGYYRVNSKERKMLGTIFTFLKSKQFIFIDAENSYTLVRKQENIIEHMYEKA